MKEEIIKQITSDFQKEEVQIVIDEFKKITLDDVMASSKANLDNTYLAILTLCKGDLLKLQELVVAAKRDFRDVIYWATIEEN